MKLFMHLPEPFVRKMRINLGCGDGRMAKHLLDRADVGTVHEQFSGKGMPQNVWCHFFDNTRPSRIFPDDILHHHGAQAALFPKGNIFLFFGMAVVQKKRFKIIITEFQVRLNGFGRRVGKKNNARLAPLSPDHKLTSLQINLGPVERNKFTHAQAG